MFKRSYMLILVLALAAMVLAACPAAAPAGDTGAAGDAAGDAEMAAPVVVRGNLGTEPPTGDPALSSDTTSGTVINLTQLGLTALNPDDFSAEPSLATDWSTSEDGLTWTFNVRTDVPWVKYNADSGEVEQVMGDDGSPRMVFLGRRQVADACEWLHLEGRSAFQVHQQSTRPCQNWR